MTDWDLFTEDINEDNIQYFSGSSNNSVRNTWEINQEINTHVMTPKSPTIVPTSPGSVSKKSRPFPFAESAPALSFMEEKDGAVPSLEPETKITKSSNKGGYYLVQFHPFRSEVFHLSDNKTLKQGDYVVTEADRGYDIGVVVQTNVKTIQKDARNIKEIVRVASRHEISQLPIKTEREKKAKEICQQKTKDLGLPMTITGAEFQFDSKKLTFYYTATSYIDFRDLVRTLFKIFGMRIWMVWHDGVGPVKDVLNRISE
jgi:hypothetical protein